MKQITHFSIFMLLALMISSCASIDNKFFKGDVIGFSDKPNTPYTDARGVFMNTKKQLDPYNLLEDQGEAAMKSDIAKVQRAKNTTAYYAMELAAKRVKYVRTKIAKNDPSTKYYIFLLTDGLDNASSQVAKNEKQILFTRTPEQYQKRVQRKLKSAMGLFHHNLFEVYPLLYIGNDLKETLSKNKNLSKEEYYQYLKDEMTCFNYSSRGTDYAPELIMADDFQTITDTLNDKFHTSVFTFRVPKGYAGKRIRMTLTNKHNEKEKIVITALLKKSLFKYYLTDIHPETPGVTFNMHGKTKLAADLSYESGKNPELKDNVNAYFVLEDLRLNNVQFYPKKFVPKKDNKKGKDQDQEIPQEYEVKTKASTMWQPNSEYTDIDEKAIDIYCMIVMDGSTSLNDQDFKRESDIARRVVELLRMNGEEELKPKTSKTKK